MINPEDFQKRSVQIRRVLNAPIPLVWQAWTQPEHIIKWWNPKGSDTVIEKHDFQVGGDWRYTMMMPNGQAFIAEGTYHEIVFHERICSEAHFRPMTEGVEIQTLFVPDGEQTEMTFNIVHATEAYRIQQERMGIQNGWGSVFNRLEEFLTNKIHQDEINDL